MQEENGTNEKQQQPSEIPSSESKQPELLSRRDALEVAFEAVTEKENASKPVIEKKEEPAQAITPEVKAAPEVPALQPPAEWSKEEKEDFLSGTRKQQEAALRLHKTRASTLETIKRERQDYEHLRKLSENVSPYIKAMGLKDTPEVAIQKAVAMWKEFEEGDPRKAAAQYLKAKGLEVPQELLDEKNSENDPLNPIQQRLESLESLIREERESKEREVLIGSWNSFQDTKNASGKPMFPDLHSDSGTNLAGQIGSLVGGKTDLSKQFIALAQMRIPDLDRTKLYAEAYKFLGGKVDDSVATKTQDKATTTEHINRARRASASVMPSGSSASTTGVTTGKMSRRDALQLAMQELRERDGH